MVGQRFNSINVFFTFFFFVILEIAKAQALKTVSSSSSSSSSSYGTSYSTEINGGEIGIKMKYNKAVNTKLNVTIYYDTETKPATDFFQGQFTPQLFQGFTACGVVEWNFMPCGTSRLDNNALSCPKGDEQCKFNQIHACIATLLSNDQQKVGQFIICFFTNNKDVNKCIGQIGLAQNNVDQCVQNQGASDCDKFFRMIHPDNPRSLRGSTGSASSEGTTAFKDVLCDHLGAARLQCNMCSRRNG